MSRRISELKDHPRKCIPSAYSNAGDRTDLWEGFRDTPKSTSSNHDSISPPISAGPTSIGDGVTMSERQRQVAALMSSFSAIADQYEAVNPHLYDTNAVLPVPVENLEIFQQHSTSEAMVLPATYTIPSSATVPDTFVDPAILPTSLGGSFLPPHGDTDFDFFNIYPRSQQLGAVSLVDGSIIPLQPSSDYSSLLSDARNFRPLTYPASAASASRTSASSSASMSSSSLFPPLSNSPVQPHSSSSHTITSPSTASQQTYNVSAPPHGEATHPYSAPAGALGPDVSIYPIGTHTRTEPQTHMFSHKDTHPHPYTRPDAHVETHDRVYMQRHVPSELPGVDGCREFSSENEVNQGSYDSRFSLGPEFDNNSNVLMLSHLPAGDIPGQFPGNEFFSAGFPGFGIFPEETCFSEVEGRHASMGGGMKPDLGMGVDMGTGTGAAAGMSRNRGIRAGVSIGEGLGAGAGVAMGVFAGRGLGSGLGSGLSMYNGSNASGMGNLFSVLSNAGAAASVGNSSTTSSALDCDAWELIAGTTHSTALVSPIQAHPTVPAYTHTSNTTPSPITAAAYTSPSGPEYFDGAKGVPTRLVPMSSFADAVADAAAHAVKATAPHRVKEGPATTVDRCEPFTNMVDVTMTVTGKNYFSRKPDVFRPRLLLPLSSSEKALFSGLLNSGLPASLVSPFISAYRANEKVMFLSLFRFQHHCIEILSPQDVYYGYIASRRQSSTSLTEYESEKNLLHVFKRARGDGEAMKKHPTRTLQPQTHAQSRSPSQTLHTSMHAHTLAEASVHRLPHTQPPALVLRERENTAESGAQAPIPVNAVFQEQTVMRVPPRVCDCLNGDYDDDTRGVGQGVGDRAVASVDNTSEGRRNAEDEDDDGGEYDDDDEDEDGECENGGGEDGEDGKDEMVGLCYIHDTFASIPIQNAAEDADALFPSPMATMTANMSANLPTEKTDTDVLLGKRALGVNGGVHTAADYDLEVNGERQGNSYPYDYLLYGDLLIPLPPSPLSPTPASPPAAAPVASPSLSSSSATPLPSTDVLYAMPVRGCNSVDVCVRVWHSLRQYAEYCNTYHRATSFKETDSAHDGVCAGVRRSSDPDIASKYAFSSFLSQIPSSLHSYASSVYLYSILSYAQREFRKTSVLKSMLKQHQRRDISFSSDPSTSSFPSACLTSPSLLAYVLCDNARIDVRNPEKSQVLEVPEDTESHKKPEFPKNVPFAENMVKHAQIGEYVTLLYLSYSTITTIFHQFSSLILSIVTTLQRTRASSFSQAWDIFPSGTPCVSNIMLPLPLFSLKPYCFTANDLKHAIREAKKKMKAIKKSDIRPGESHRVAAHDGSLVKNAVPKEHGEGRKETTSVVVRRQQDVDATATEAEETIRRTNRVNRSVEMDKRPTGLTPVPVRSTKKLNSIHTMTEAMIASFGKLRPALISEELHSRNVFFFVDSEKSNVGSQHHIRKRASLKTRNSESETSDEKDSRLHVLVPSITPSVTLRYLGIPVEMSFAGATTQERVQSRTGGLVTAEGALIDVSALLQTVTIGTAVAIQPGSEEHTEGAPAVSAPAVNQGTPDSTSPSASACASHPDMTHANTSKHPPPHTHMHTHAHTFPHADPPSHPGPPSPLLPARPRLHPRSPLHTLHPHTRLQAHALPSSLAPLVTTWLKCISPHAYHALLHIPSPHPSAEPHTEANLGYSLSTSAAAVPAHTTSTSPAAASSLSTSAGSSLATDTKWQEWLAYALAARGLTPGKIPIATTRNLQFPESSRDFPSSFSPPSSSSSSSSLYASPHSSALALTVGDRTLPSLLVGLRAIHNTICSLPTMTSVTRGLTNIPAPVFLCKEAGSRDTCAPALATAAPTFASLSKTHPIATAGMEHGVGSQKTGDRVLDSTLTSAYAYASPSAFCLGVPCLSAEPITQYLTHAYLPYTHLPVLSDHTHAPWAEAYTSLPPRAATPYTSTACPGTNSYTQDLDTRVPSPQKAQMPVSSATAQAPTQTSPSLPENTDSQDGVSQPLPILDNLSGKPEFSETLSSRISLALELTKKLDFSNRRWSSLPLTEIDAECMAELSSLVLGELDVLKNNPFMMYDDADEDEALDGDDVESGVPLREQRGGQGGAGSAHTTNTVTETTESAYKTKKSQISSLIATLTIRAQQNTPTWRIFFSLLNDIYTSPLISPSYIFASPEERSFLLDIFFSGSSLERSPSFTTLQREDRQRAGVERDLERAERQAQEVLVQVETLLRSMGDVSVGGVTGEPDVGHRACLASMYALTGLGGTGVCVDGVDAGVDVGGRSDGLGGVRGVSAGDTSMANTKTHTSCLPSSSAAFSSHTPPSLASTPTPTHSARLPAAPSCIRPCFYPRAFEAVADTLQMNLPLPPRLLTQPFDTSNLPTRPVDTTSSQTPPRTPSSPFTTQHQSASPASLPPLWREPYCNSLYSRLCLSIGEGLGKTVRACFQEFMAQETRNLVFLESSSDSFSSSSSPFPDSPPNTCNVSAPVLSPPMTRYPLPPQLPSQLPPTYTTAHTRLQSTCTPPLFTSLLARVDTALLQSAQASPFYRNSTSTKTTTDASNIRTQRCPFTGPTSTVSTYTPPRYDAEPDISATKLTSSILKSKDAKIRKTPNNPRNPENSTSPGISALVQFVGLHSAVIIDPQIQKKLFSTNSNTTVITEIMSSLPFSGKIKNPGLSKISDIPSDVIPWLSRACMPLSSLPNAQHSTPLNTVDEVNAVEIIQSYLHEQRPSSLSSSSPAAMASTTTSTNADVLLQQVDMLMHTKPGNIVTSTVTNTSSSARFSTHLPATSPSDAASPSHSTSMMLEIAQSSSNAIDTIHNTLLTLTKPILPQVPLTDKATAAVVTHTITEMTLPNPYCFFEEYLELKRDYVMALAGLPALSDNHVDSDRIANNNSDTADSGSGVCGGVGVRGDSAPGASTTSYSYTSAHSYEPPSPQLRSSPRASTAPLPLPTATLPSQSLPSPQPQSLAPLPGITSTHSLSPAALWRRLTSTTTTPLVHQVRSRYRCEEDDDVDVCDAVEEEVEREHAGSYSGINSGDGRSVMGGPSPSSWYSRQLPPPPPLLATSLVMSQTDILSSAVYTSQATMPNSSLFPLTRLALVQTEHQQLRDLLRISWSIVCSAIKIRDMVEILGIARSKVLYNLENMLYNIQVMIMQGDIDTAPGKHLQDSYAERLQHLDDLNLGILSCLSWLLHSQDAIQGFIGQLLRSMSALAHRHLSLLAFDAVMEGQWGAEHTPERKSGVLDHLQTTISGIAKPRCPEECFIFREGMYDAFVRVSTDTSGVGGCRSSCINATVHTSSRQGDNGAYQRSRHQGVCDACTRSAERSVLGQVLRQHVLHCTPITANTTANATATATATTTPSTTAVSTGAAHPQVDSLLSHHPYSHQGQEEEDEDQEEDDDELPSLWKINIKNNPQNLEETWKLGVFPENGHFFRDSQSSRFAPIIGIYGRPMVPIAGNPVDFPSYSRPCPRTQTQHTRSQDQANACVCTRSNTSPISGSLPTPPPHTHALPPPSASPPAPSVSHDHEGHHPSQDKPQVTRQRDLSEFLACLQTRYAANTYCGSDIDALVMMTLMLDTDASTGVATSNGAGVTTDTGTAPANGTGTSSDTHTATSTSMGTSVGAGIGSGTRSGGVIASVGR